MIDIPVISRFRPEAEEYAPFYKGYVDLVPGNDIVAVLENNKKNAIELFKSIVWEKWVDPFGGDIDESKWNNYNEDENYDTLFEENPELKSKFIKPIKVIKFGAIF